MAPTPGGKRDFARFDCIQCSRYVLSIMAAANASARGQRAAILASPLSELTGFNLAVDCLSPGWSRERTFALADLATFYGGGRTVGDVLRRMRCSDACGGRVGAAWPVTGPVLNARVRPRRVALLGPEARE
jgi:hypothetical protein